MNQWGYVGLLLAFLILAFAMWASPVRPVASCSIERGSVKYLRDAGSAKIVWTPKVAAISTLYKIPAVALTYSIRTPAETQVYKVTAFFQFARLETDGDIHVVIKDAYNRSMIAEIPSPVCVTNRHLPNIQTMRDLVMGLTPGAKIQITGVLFLDFAHGQTGHAPNYVELHPVTAVKKL